jgi:anti-sigma B factor antagonist
MTETTADLDVRAPSPSVSIIDIRGEVTGRSDGVLERAYDRACGQATRVVVLNFTLLEYMNSSGIGLLVMLLVRARRKKQRLLAFGLDEHYRQIFDLTRLDEAIGIHADEAAALAAAAGL